MVSEADSGRRLFDVIEKWTEPMVVVAAKCRDRREIPSRIWMVHDWIQQCGRRATAGPSCLFAGDGAPPESAVCEVQWGIDGGVPGSYGDLCIKIIPAAHVFGTVHSGPAETLAETLHTLASEAAAHGCRMVSHREIYHAPQLTEVQVAVVCDRSPS